MPRCIVRHNYHDIAIFYWLHVHSVVPSTYPGLSPAPWSFWCVHQWWTPPLKGGRVVWSHTCTHTIPDTQGQESCNKLRYRVEHPWKEEEWVMTTYIHRVSCPDPVLSWRKGSGDYWAISWLCRLSSIDFEGTLITCLHDARPISLVYVHTWMTWHYFIGLSKIKTVDPAQPRNHSTVTRPFSSWEGGIWAWD